MQRTTLIWFDMTVTTRHAEAEQKFRDHFDIRFCSNANRPEDECNLDVGVAFCFEFDYPDQSGMSLLCRTKERYPHIPVLMLTTQHSEKLAIWAYRNRVLDYLVKPVSEIEFRRCKDLLQSIRSAETRQQGRAIINHKALVPVGLPVEQSTGCVRLAPAVHFVQRNFAGKIRNAEIAALCGVSPSHFSRAFAEQFSISFQEFVLRYRIFQACKQLRHPGVSVANIAEAVGFNDPSYFARMFKRFVGMSPSSFCERIGTVDLEQRVEGLIDNLQLAELRRINFTPQHSRNNFERDIAASNN